MPDAPSPESFPALALTVDAMRHDVARLARFARDGVNSIPGGIARAVRNPTGSLRAGGGLVGSIARTVRPVRSTLSDVMLDRRLAWHYETISMPLQDLRGPARELGLTVNDAFLGAVTGGLQRYHERHGSAVGFGPTIGAALNATLVSYNGTCQIGVNIDTGAIPDGATFMECMREGFAECAALSTTSEPRLHRS